METPIVRIGATVKMLSPSVRPVQLNKVILLNLQTIYYTVLGSHY